MKRLSLGMLAVGLFGCSAGGGSPSDGGTMERAGSGGAGTGGTGSMTSLGTGGGAAVLTGCSVNSLLADCGFESPVVPIGGMQTFSVGDTLAGWTVVGAPGNVALMSATFADMGFQWSAHDGSQMIDLTGTSRSATGLSQSVATNPGATYSLSFWLGNLVDPTGYYGVYSAVRVMVDGVQVAMAQNPDGDHETVLTWEQSTVEFTASASSTTIGFINDDSIVDNSNILDDIVLVPK